MSSTSLPPSWNAFLGFILSMKLTLDFESESRKALQLAAISLAVVLSG